MTPLRVTRRVPTLATVTVNGKDRSGVVARMTVFLFQSKANIEALEEEVQRGQFHMALQCSWKTSPDRDAVEAALEGLGEELGMEVRIRWMDPRRRMRMAVFCTKEPEVLDALLGAAKAGRLKAAPVLVVSNRRDLAAVAKKHRLPFVVVPWTDPKRAEPRVLKALDEHDVDFIVLARFMRILSPAFVWRWRNRIINIHPSLLPAFPGAASYRQAWEHGVRVVGVTAHFVTPALDEGPIIAQDAFRVKAATSLVDIVARGRRLEGRVLVEAVRLYVARRLDVHWGRVHES